MQSILCDLISSVAVQNATIWISLGFPSAFYFHGREGCELLYDVQNCAEKDPLYPKQLLYTDR